MGSKGDRNGYPGRGLSGWGERAGSDQCNFLGLVSNEAEAFAGTDEDSDRRTAYALHQRGDRR